MESLKINVALARLHAKAGGWTCAVCQADLSMPDCWVVFLDAKRTSPICPECSQKISTPGIKDAIAILNSTAESISEMPVIGIVPTGMTKNGYCAFTGGDHFARPMIDREQPFVAAAFAAGSEPVAASAEWLASKAPTVYRALCLANGVKPQVFPAAAKPAPTADEVAARAAALQWHGALRAIAYALDDTRMNAEVRANTILQTVQDLFGLKCVAPPDKSSQK